MKKVTRQIELQRVNNDDSIWKITILQGKLETTHAYFYCVNICDAMLLVQARFACDVMLKHGLVEFPAQYAKHQMDARTWDTCTGCLDALLYATTTVRR